MKLYDELGRLLTSISGKASEISIVDVGNIITATEVESALQEIFADYQAGGVSRTLGGDLDANNHSINNVSSIDVDTIYHNVTSKAAVDTLTVAEAGVILVSAGADYTLTLPTAVGHTGLTYKFVKTDSNYNVITLDGAGGETIAGNLTYTFLNTLQAKITIVSDGANWQIINEDLGIAPECYAYLSANQINIVSGAVTLVDLDTEDYDIGGNFDIVAHRFTAPIPGMYRIDALDTYNDTNIVADKPYSCLIYRNGASIGWYTYHTSHVGVLAAFGFTEILLAKNDFIELNVFHVAGVNTIQLIGVSRASTHLNIRLISKS